MSSTIWPTRGQVLTHHLKKNNSEITATVVEVDKSLGRIRVEVNGTIYKSLSAAAIAVSGHASNGWIFWGLKKQPYRRKNVGAT